MHFGIDGRSALVVGGSKGIGFEVANQLAGEGARVAVLARTKTDVDAAVETIRGDGGTAIGVSADVGNEQQLGDAVRVVTAEHGPPLIVIGQAKYQRPGDFADISDLNVYRESFEMHTMSQILLLQAVLPAMKDAGWGRFVHIGSATAKEPAGNIHHAVANTSRPSTIGLLKTVSDEYAQHGITVNTVAPGWIETENALAYLKQHLGAGTDRSDATSCSPRPASPRRGWANPRNRLAHHHPFSEPAGYLTGSWTEVDGGLHRPAF